ncbi:hypothetical protein OH76DRAFT_1416864 [Lentinus brumalis]|uniref:Uncharacterized protein n=1 Tax=Lentinus brumalis TaxID=2498619 RepID=A0A371DIH3_9APHY|nr:hypothetical protein OH76DRAFT_1416864 [Polyporus brumalis]
MSVSTRRILRLPSEDDKDSTNGANRSSGRAIRQQVGDYVDEIPVASDEEGTVIGNDGTLTEGREAEEQQGRQQSEESSLPSSSPISFPSTDIECSPPGRAANPSALFQFDGCESMDFEDGELHEAAPPANQQAMTEDERAMLRELDQLNGEQYASHRRDSVPIQRNRKRSWGGSQGSEEMSRTARRARRDEATPAAQSYGLPPIAEMLANPWGEFGMAEDAQERNTRPLACSTPRNVSQYDTKARYPLNSRFSFDSQANVSGNPPTPFARANTTLDSKPSPRAGTDRQEDNGIPWATSRDRHDDGQRMLIDTPDEDDEESSLLRTPPGPRTRRYSASAADLRRTLADPPSANEKAGGNRTWQGGYAPHFWNQEAIGPNGKSRIPAVEDWGADGDGSVHGDTFSPIPHTKAWHYQQEMLENRERRAREAGDWDDQTHASFDERSRSAAAPGTGAEREPTRMRSQATGYAQRAPFGDVAWRDDEDDAMRADISKDWRNFDMVPTAVALGPCTKDEPTLVENPRDKKWEVHFDDPERLVCGQSVEWQREMWKDESAVIFSAYNYRYTTNGVVNRHVESAVTAITSYVTGENRFYVVPPDLDQRHALDTRDLPFIWGIRGLTAEGAARMAAIRVASSQGVSIITYPKRLRNPRWTCSLVGFLRPDVDVIRDAFLLALQDPKMREWLTKMTNASVSLRRIPREQRVDYILSTVEVRIADLDGGDFMANVYVEPPTDDMAEWREWVAYLRTRKYNNFRNGTGTARQVYWCAGCRGVDHDTMRCPFPEMKGWQGTGVGAKSHTSELLGTRRGRPEAGRGGVVRGGGTWTSAPRDGGDWSAGSGRHRSDGRDSARRNDGWRGRTPTGRPPWSGGHAAQRQHQSQRPQQSQRWNQTQQWADMSTGGWRM